MTQHPTDEAKNRAEALEQAKHAVSYAAAMSLKDEDYVEICPSKLKIWKEFLSALSATDAPIVEGEEWECFCDEAYYHQWAVRNKNGDCSFTSAIHVRTKDEAEFLVSRLNAQGRTRCAPEGAESNNEFQKLDEVQF